MAKFTDAWRVTLSNYFNTGDQPTEAQFAQLMLSIQEGIEEALLDGTGDGDSSVSQTGILMADDAWIGIGAGLERITFDAAGDITIGGANFGVNVGTPLKRAHFRESEVVGLDLDANVRTVAVFEEGAAGGRIALGAPNTGSSAIDFSDSDDWNVGEILYDHSGDYMTFRTNDAERVRITNAGVIKIANLAGVGVRNVSADANGNLVV